MNLLLTTALAHCTTQGKIIGIAFALTMVVLMSVGPALYFHITEQRKR